MTKPRDEVSKLVQQWVERAEDDLRNAEHTLTLEEDCPFGTVCFHAQQCVEKYLKALMVLHGVDFPKIHNIPELLALVPSSVRPELSAEEQERLTDYATVCRYPGDWEPLSREEAGSAVKVARKIREAVRELMLRAPKPE
jgi:HEPN domain-containing protein